MKKDDIYAALFGMVLGALIIGLILRLVIR